MEAKQKVALTFALYQGETLVRRETVQQDIVKVARQRYPGIESDGRRRILAGETSIEEVMRVTSIA